MNKIMIKSVGEEWKQIFLAGMGEIEDIKMVDESELSMDDVIQTMEEVKKVPGVESEEECEPKIEKLEWDYEDLGISLWEDRKKINEIIDHINKG
jgi:hypothetical protein